MFTLKYAFCLRAVAVAVMWWCLMFATERLPQATAAGVFCLLLTMPLPER